jgi:hypothetical protein
MTEIIKANGDFLVHLYQYGGKQALRTAVSTSTCFALFEREQRILFLIRSSLGRARFDAK